MHFFPNANINFLHVLFKSNAESVGKQNPELEVVFLTKGSSYLFLFHVGGAEMALTIHPTQG